MERADNVIVIGGGIVGASAAYRLARSGARVTLVDRADVGQATAAGAGIISPGTSYHPPAPFFPLAFRAVAYYDTLLAALAEDGETEKETGFEVVGLLHVAMTEAEATALPVLLRLIEERRASGAPRIGAVQTFSGDEARALFPALGACLGAIFTSEAARVDGRLLRDAMRRGAARHGARIVVGSAEAIREVGGGVELTVNGETLTAGAAILAGGAWSGALAETLGEKLRLPVFPQRGQILHLRLPGQETARWPIVVGFHSHYLLTFPQDRVVAGATRESDAGFDPRMTAGGVREALDEALRVAPGLAGATLQEVRVGLRPASPDGLPMLGRIPGSEHLYVATGHGASGLQLGPYSGALVADLALGKPSAADLDVDTDLDLTPFAPGRFASRP
ncbi:MAG TPA: FAD-dependent oxidoreductase [Ktedonobacterales bacterium]|nr:FAD-dependent oxidoreductase [Ktedonobacterales bacterium]